MKRIRRRGVEAVIPTSSMADIAFLLIIFFMVTAVFSATQGLELRYPRPDDADPKPTPSVLVQVTPTGVLVDCLPVPVREVAVYLRSKLTGDPQRPVILYTDPDAEYQDFVDVYDVIARSAEGPRVMNIAVPTRGEIDGYIEAFGFNPLEAHCTDR